MIILGSMRIAEADGRLTLEFQQWLEELLAENEALKARLEALENA